MKHSIRPAVLAVVVSALWAAPVHAEATAVRLAKQFGIGYLPLTLMEEQGLFEKHASEAGLELTTEWLRFTGGSGMNEALLSGNLDLAAGGTTPMLTIWARTQSNLQVRGVAALSSMPLQLVSMNPEIETVADFKAGDRIALPAVKTSIQAITLQMAAEKYLGEGQEAALDSLTVSMGHPDAQIALMGGQSEVNSHFGSPPFQNVELTDPRARKVLDSYDVLEGPHTFTVVWAKNEFIENNPKLTAAFMAALEESIAFIQSDPQEAARIWAEAEATNLTQEEVVAIIEDAQTRWTTTPERLVPYVNFMARVGLIQADTNDWRDLFFDTVSASDGS